MLEVLPIYTSVNFSRVLHKLKDEKVPDALNPSNIKNYTVNWGPGITLEQHADYLRLVWVSIHFA